MFKQNFPIEIVRAQLSDAQAIAEVHVASWRTTYCGIMDDTLLEKLSVSNREKQWKKILEENGGLNSCWIAKQAGRVIGFADGGKSREDKSTEFDAELYAIYLLKDSGRQGLGSLLLSRVVSDCIKNGFHSMITWVAEKNEYRYFYEFCGAILLPFRKIEKFGESEIVEVAYGWNDLHILERKLAAKRQD